MTELLYPEKSVDANLEGLKGVRMLLMDVDGVLTDGRIVYDAHGQEIKSFSVKDGMGLRLLMDAGIPVGIVTGRSSGALQHRVKDLGIDLLFDGVTDKAGLLNKISQQTGIPAGSTAFIGDDLPDIPIMKKVGVPIAVADAVPAVLAAADLVTAAKGGHGAVREVCEAVLKSHGLWERLVGKF